MFGRLIQLLGLLSWTNQVLASSDPVADKRCVDSNGPGWEAQLDASGKAVRCQKIISQDDCFPDWLNPHTGKYECWLAAAFPYIIVSHLTLMCIALSGPLWLQTRTLALAPAVARGRHYGSMLNLKPELAVIKACIGVTMQLPERAPAVNLAMTLMVFIASLTHRLQLQVSLPHLLQHRHHRQSPQRVCLYLRSAVKPQAPQILQNPTLLLRPQHLQPKVCPQVQAIQQQIKQYLPLRKPQPRPKKVKL